MENENSMFQRETKTNKTFVKIVNGKLSVKVNEKTNNSFERKNANDEVIHEERFGSLIGYITKLDVNSEGNFGQELLIDLSNNGQTAQIQVKLDSGYAHDFLSRVEGVDLTKPVEIASYKIPRKDNPEKHNYILLIKQDGVNVAKRYTKENPNGLPSATQKKVGKKMEWDFSAITDFYYEVAKNVSEKILEKKSEIMMLSNS